MALFLCILESVVLNDLGRTVQTTEGIVGVRLRGNLIVLHVVDGVVELGR